MSVKVICSCGREYPQPSPTLRCVCGTIVALQNEASEQREAALVEALRYYAELGDDDIPYAKTINDPPDVGFTARAALAAHEQAKP